MRTIKVYDYFLDNVENHFKVRYFLISLNRTYIYNFNHDKTIYYRKRNNNPRKMTLIDKSKVYKMKDINFKKFNFSKYGMHDINKIMAEYLISINNKNNSRNFKFDIAKRDQRLPIVVDSMVSDGQDEMTTMCFDDKKIKSKFKNIFWIDDVNKYGVFNNYNVNN